jgi:hypothetical protein
MNLTMPVAEVKALGYDEKHAAQVVERLLKSIRTRPDDDSGLKGAAEDAIVLVVTPSAWQ